MLHKQPRHLVKQLAKCPIVTYQQNANGTRVPLYDFQEAMSYCVEPKIDILQWLKSQNAMTLPPHINKAFWDAMRSRQMVGRAKHLWKDEEVLDVLGRVALTIRETAMLWVENLPGKERLTQDQFDFLRAEVLSLLTDIHRRLVDMPKERRTRASIGDFEDMSRVSLGNEE